MRKNIFLIVVLAWVLASCSTPKETPRNEFTVVSYNVENLFDTVDDPKIPDEEFLPESEKKWDSERYQKKLNDISRVISGISPNDLPEIVGLVEIENRSVLEDLIDTGSLKGKGYAIIHEDSPDYRGIDVALIYRKDDFTEISHETLPVVFPDDPEFKTRDILHVTGKIGDKIVHIFVNHWPSRIGGNEQTEPKRVLAASVLKNRVDQLLAEDPEARIIIMGDMNDEPANKSLEQTLGAKLTESGASLINLMMPEKLAGRGTYFYSGDWNMLDNLIVSGGLIRGKGISIEGNKGYIFNQSWMIYTNQTGDKTPNRTYVGEKYTGGVSDHFPVYFKMLVK